MTETVPISLRVEPAQLALLTKAAEVLRKDRSAFILDVACLEAENVLLDRRLFQLNQADFEAFEATLTSPITNNARLKALLKEPSPWEK